MSRSLFFNKVAGLRPATLLKSRLQHGCFLMNFAKFLRTLVASKRIIGEARRAIFEVYIRVFSAWLLKVNNTGCWLLLVSTNPFIHNVDKWPNILWKSCGVNTAGFLKYVWPFFNMNEKVKTCLVVML